MNLLVRDAGPLNFLIGRWQLLYFINAVLLFPSNEELVGTSLFLLFDFAALVIFGYRRA